MSLLGTATSALVAYQKALATTGHNIANSTTDGYRRQVVELSSNEPQRFGVGYIGRGVSVSAINRSYDQFLYQQVLSRNSQSQEHEAYLGVASQLDATLADPNAGIATVLESFFNSVQDLSSNPTSLPARQVVITQGQSLADRFHSLDRQLSDMRDSVNGRLNVAVTQINELANAIADINLDIVRATGEAGGAPPNDLLDQREVLIQKLSDYTTVTTNQQDDGSTNVFIGTGQSLVLGSTASKLVVINNDFDSRDQQIALEVNGIVSKIGSQLSGGIVGGLLAVKTDVIDAAQASLGQIATAITSQFNQQHQLGDDLNGNPGGLFFTDILATSPLALANSNNNPGSGDITITIDDVNQLHASDYRLNFNGSSNSFSLVRLSDNTLVNGNIPLASFPASLASEGITLSLTGTVADGDSFLLRPAHYAAAQFGVSISDPSTIAAAASGTAVGNNENALALAQLQISRSMNNSKSSYQEAFGSLVADVGVKTNRAMVNGQAQHSLLERAMDALDSVSGVNLDEEAANLLKFQQIYQANARVITTADDIFQSLLNALR